MKELSNRLLRVSVVPNASINVIAFGVHLVWGKSQSSNISLHLAILELRVNRKYKL